MCSLCKHIVNTLIFQVASLQGEHVCAGQNNSVPSAQGSYIPPCKLINQHLAPQILLFRKPKQWISLPQCTNTTQFLSLSLEMPLY